MQRKFKKKINLQENKCYHFYKGNISWVKKIIDSIVLMNFKKGGFNLLK